MNIRYVSQDLEWSDSMKAVAHKKIVEPLVRVLGSEDFELAVHFGADRKRMQSRKPTFEMWVVFQGFDGHSSEVIHRRADSFTELAYEVGLLLRLRVRKMRERNHKDKISVRLLTAEETA